MKKLILALALLLASTAHAQTRVMAGVDAGSGFGSLYAGPTVGIEHEIKHLELDAYDTYMAAYQHPAGGGDGHANSFSAGPIVWFKSVGLDANIDDSMYTTATVHKNQQFITGGVTLRKSIQGMPIRFYFNYIQEILNGIDSTGTETSNLRGGEYRMDMLTGCHGAVCFRLDMSAKIGVVQPQGNPVCDSTFGVTGGPNNGPCPRGWASSGSFGAKLMVMNRPRGHEQDPF